jgi:uncharacterized repeat protein (TIGR03803 family)
MRNTSRSPLSVLISSLAFVTKRGRSRTLWVVLVFCAAMVISSPAQTLTTLASFNETDGAYPYASLVQGIDGNLYGAIFSGGDNPNCIPDGCGTVVRISPQGTVTRLYSFCSLSNCADGGNPSGGLVQGTDGNFYGTTSGTGERGGTVFKITPSGTLTTLYSFCSQPNCTDGSSPWGGVVQGSDGNFYGTTESGGSSTACGGGCGTVFKITPSGALTTLHSFDGADGWNPFGALVQATDGDFYGTTYYAQLQGSDYCCGTVFKITSAGVLTTLYSFSGSPSDDMLYPIGGLVQASDGNFYGTTNQGGNNGTDAGTVFRITPGGSVTLLYSFCSQPNCADGADPMAGLVQATDGNLYGTTWGGSIDRPGTAFKISPNGTLTTLYQFCSRPNCTDGGQPAGGLVQATDGIFYGTTELGGTGDCFGGYGCGTVFSLNVGLGMFVEAQPTSGTVGTAVTILGTNLTGATNVTFNGTPATINSNTGSAITTTVPVGATTGVVQVSLPGTTVISNTDFQVFGPIQFVPVTPCRLVDTRNGNPIQGGTLQSFIIPQLGNCGIPASAAAYSLNVTLVPPGPVGYLTIWPNGEIQPFASTMNSPDGRVKANAAIVPSGNNAVSVYVSNTTNILLDIDGYFAPAGSSTLEFYPLTPCRIVDTRNGQNGGTLQAGVERDYLIAGACGVPDDATAYSFNVTVLPTQGSLDYLTVWPQGETMPVVSTLNDNTGTVVANAAIVPAGSNNTTAFYAHNHDTNLLLDVNGYFAAPGQNGLSLYPAAPCRVLDTRQNNGQPFSGKLVVNVEGSACAPPSSAQAYVFNATVVPPGSMPYLTLWADGQPQPVVSTLNAYDGFITSNMAIVPTGPTNPGSIDAYAAGLTQLILDISGYFAP